MTQILNQLKGLLAKVLDFIPDSVMNLFDKYKIPILIVLIALCVLVALEGYKIFKGALYVLMSVAFGFVAYKWVAGFVMSKVGGMLPAAPFGISYEAVIVVAFAIAAVFLVKFAYKFTLLILGGAVGFVIGYLGVARAIIGMFPTLAFLNSTPAKAIIGLVFAAIVGIAFILLFKHLFILGTGLGCMAAAGFLTALLVMPSASMLYKIAFAGFAMLIGIYCTIHQYNEEQRAQDIRFYS